MRTLTILGATGSIGRSTVDVVARHPERYRVHALAANASVDMLEQQCLRLRPRFAVLVEAGAAADLARRLQAQGSPTEVLAGVDALEAVAAAPEADTVMAAIVGAAGLRSALAAARAGKRILLANKEALVMAGDVFLSAVRAGGAQLLPIDSEHNAVFQCLPGGRADGPGVRRILLTASGGPFRDRALADLEHVSPDEACAHPNWRMGRKISVDSATMMNKGLELIEASLLFGLPGERIDVVVHPQSIIHSLVEYVDGSMLAQLGNPDMRTPIAHALAFPERIDSGVGSLDLIAAARLDFQAPDPQRFPCLRLAREALSGGGGAPCVLNAANEVAVARFLDGELSFPAIAAVAQAVLEDVGSQAPPADLEAVLALDALAREAATRHGRRLAA